LRFYRLCGRLRPIRLETRPHRPPEQNRLLKNALARLGKE